MIMIKSPERWSEARLMLEVMQVCIDMQIIPNKNSPCDKRLKKIIRNLKQKEKNERKLHCT